MRPKFKLGALGAIAVTALAAAGIVALRGRDYLLNRTVRRVALRLVQMETLSRTTRVDYRVVFWNNRCVVEQLDRESGRWLPSSATAYSRGVVSEPAGILVTFSGGRFAGVSLPDGRGRTPPYLILDFRIPGTTKKRSIIFYREGNWRILG